MECSLRDTCPGFTRHDGSCSPQTQQGERGFCNCTNPFPRTANPWRRRQACIPFSPALAQIPVCPIAAKRTLRVFVRSAFGRRKSPGRGDGNRRTYPEMPEAELGRQAAERRRFLRLGRKLPKVSVRARRSPEVPESFSELTSKLGRLLERPGNARSSPERVADLSGAFRPSLLPFPIGLPNAERKSPKTNDSRRRAFGRSRGGPSAGSEVTSERRGLFRKFPNASEAPGRAGSGATQDGGRGGGYSGREAASGVEGRRPEGGFGAAGTV